jgi:hypothetical protein
LNLVGATWFIATNDEFVRYSYIGGGQNPDDICKNINGYGNPCPVGEGSVVKANSIAIAILAIFAWLFKNKNVDLSNLVRTTRFWDNLQQVCSKSKEWKAK